MIWLLLACSEVEVDSGQDTGFCTDAPVTTWDNFGAGFVTQNCQSCHASTADNREGAPEDVFFDSSDDVAAHADRMLVRVVDEPTMPPQGGVSDDDRYRFEVWLRCE